MAHLLQPIHRFAGNGDIEALRRELDSGTSPNAREDNGTTPLHLACASSPDPTEKVDERVACVKLLVEAGADIHATENYKGATPLHFAAGWMGHAALVTALLDAGANANIRDNWTWTPLHCACFKHFSDVETVFRLINAGASAAAVTTNTNDRDTPLHLAAPQGNHRLYPILLRAGCPPLLQDFWAPRAYLQKVAAAGSFRSYERNHLNALSMMLIPKFPCLPPEMVRRVVEYAFHVGDY